MLCGENFNFIVRICMKWSMFCLYLNNNNNCKWLGNFWLVYQNQEKVKALTSFISFSWVGWGWPWVLLADVMTCWSSDFCFLLLHKESFFFGFQISCSWFRWFLLLLLVRTSVLCSCKLMVKVLPATSGPLVTSSSFWVVQMIEMSHRWYFSDEFKLNEF